LFPNISSSKDEIVMGGLYNEIYNIRECKRNDIILTTTHASATIELVVVDAIFERFVFISVTLFNRPTDRCTGMRTGDEALSLFLENVSIDCRWPKAILNFLE
jgi:hypothetical protein